MKLFRKGRKTLVATVVIAIAAIIMIVSVGISNKEYENIMYPEDLLLSFCSELNNNNFSELEGKICSSSEEIIVSDLEYFTELYDVEITVREGLTQQLLGDSKSVQIGDDILCLVEPIRYTTQDGEDHSVIITVYFYKGRLAIDWNDIPLKARLLKFRPFIDTGISLMDVLREPSKY